MYLSTRTVLWNRRLLAKTHGRCIYSAMECCFWREKTESCCKLAIKWSVVTLLWPGDYVMSQLFSSTTTLAKSVCCAQDTMRSSRFKSMAFCRPLGPFSSGFYHSSRPSRLFLGFLTLYRRWATITYTSLDPYACLSLHHPLVGCPHLLDTTLLPLYRIPDSPHIYNFLTFSPSHG